MKTAKNSDMGNASAAPGQRERSGHELPGTGSDTSSGEKPGLGTRVNDTVSAIGLAVGALLGVGSWETYLKECVDQDQNAEEAATDPAAGAVPAPHSGPKHYEGPRTPFDEARGRPSWTLTPVVQRPAGTARCAPTPTAHPLPRRAATARSRTCR